MKMPLDDRVLLLIGLIAGKAYTKTAGEIYKMMAGILDTSVDEIIASHEELEARGLITKNGGPHE